MNPDEVKKLTGVYHKAQGKLGKYTIKYSSVWDGMKGQFGTHKTKGLFVLILTIFTEKASWNWNLNKNSDISHILW